MNAEEAQEFFLSSFEPTSRIETLPLEECEGRIIAENAIAGMNVPHYRRAAMDGFAVVAKDTLGAGSGSPAILRFLENNTMEIGIGACKRVHTGSLMPEWADAVVMMEDAVLHDDMVEIFAQVHPLKNVGVVGEDVGKGDTIKNDGDLLRPCDMAVLAATGIRKIKVFKRPLVVIIPTGEELVPRNRVNLKDGEIYETNGLMASLYIKKWGGIPKLLEIVNDSPEEIEKAIRSNLDTDLIITSGGTSVGKRDYVPSVIDSIGELLVHGVGISPGKPAALGLIDGKPVVCMPGYPVAGIVALFYFGKAAFRELGRFPDVAERTIHAILSEKIVGRTGYKTFVRVKIENGRAIPLATSGAGILSSVSRADGFVIIPENIEGRNAGEEVEVVLIE